MTSPPRFPFTDPHDALDALLAGTYTVRTIRWAEHMRDWLNTERPPLGCCPVTTEHEEAA